MTLSLQTSAKVLAVAFGLALLAGFGWQMAQRGAWRERLRDLQAQVDSTDRVLVQYRADSAAWARTLAALSRRATNLAKDSARLAGELGLASARRAAADSALAAAQAAVDEQQLPPPLQALLAAQQDATAALAAEGQACQRSLANAQAQRTTCEEMADTLRHQVASLERLNGRLLAERDSARALLKPPSLLALTFELTAGPGCSSNGRQTVCGGSVQATVLRFRIPLFR